MTSPAVLTASASWRCIEFISDLHLCADTPRTFDAWAHYLQSTQADAVLMLGDVFEVWVGDDARVQDFEARCVQVMADASKQRKLYFMAGNRDFLLSADMLKDCGMSALEDPTLMEAFGERVLLTHGDALCLADVSYQQFRKMVRDEQWQRGFLAQPLPVRQHIARQIRGESEHRKQGSADMAEWADVDAAEAVSWLRQAETHTLIHGHTHRPGDSVLATGFQRKVLTDWDMDHPPLRAEVLRWTAQGFARVPWPAAA